MTAQSSLLTCALLLSPSAIRESAYRGDLEHKLDLHRLFGDCSDSDFLVLLAATSQATYLRNKRPELVPPKNPNGTVPNDHTVSTYFEHYYQVDNDFAKRYLKWVRNNHQRL